MILPDQTDHVGLWQSIQMLFDHATPVEGAFTVISLFATTVSIYTLRDAMIDAAIQTAAKINGPRRVIAENNIHQEQLRLGISLVMLMASISFLFLEPPPPSYWYLPQSLVGLIGWILVSSIVCVSSFIDKSIRKRLQKYAPFEVTTNSVTVQPSLDPGVVNTQETMLQQAQAARESINESGGRRSSDHAKEK